MMTRSARSLLVAGVLLGATSVTAQVPRPLPRSPAPAPGGDARPAPGRPDAQETAGAAQAPQLTEDARRLLGRIHLRNAFQIWAGQLAQQQGHSQDVKELGRKLEQEAHRVDAEVAVIARERGVEPGALPLPVEERGAYDQMMARLRELQGEQFDREFVQETIQVEQRYVQDLKDMRDRTPGKDARLKKWLDDTENVAEARLSMARETKRALDEQRAARRPPGR